MTANCQLKRRKAPKSSLNSTVYREEESLNLHGCSKSENIQKQSAKSKTTFRLTNAKKNEKELITPKLNLRLEIAETPDQAAYGSPDQEA
jgi:hypothetical protein